MVLHSSMNDQVQLWAVSKAIFAKTLIDSQYLVSPRQSIQHFEWSFMPVNMTVVLTPSPHPFSISLPTMLSSAKVTSTSKSSTMSMAKITVTNNAVADVSNIETSVAQ